MQTSAVVISAGSVTCLDGPFKRVSKMLKYREKSVSVIGLAMFDWRGIAGRAGSIVASGVE